MFGGIAVTWRRLVEGQSDKPFSDPEERQELRASTELIRVGQERKEARSRIYGQVRRFIVWLTGMSAFVIGASQVPEAISKIMKFIRGGV